VSIKRFAKVEIRGGGSINNRYIWSTFQSLVQAIIPPITFKIKSLGFVQQPGAMECKVYEYVIWILNHSISQQVKVKLNIVSMAMSTAELLDLGAVQLIQNGQNTCPLNLNRFPNGGLFSKLSPIDRLKALTLIENLELNLKYVSPPYQNNPDHIRQIVVVLNQLTMFGFYSEWTGYGTTGLSPPEFRRLEYFPHRWISAKYPGPSYAYRDFRGFLACMSHKKGKDKD